jgi:Ca2+-binding RTX toxin-like protein
VGTAAIASGDFNGDGNLDLVTANLRSNNASILIGNGQGRFTAQLSVPVGDSPYGIVTGDFNGDGRIDFATANLNDVSVVLNQGNSSFKPAVNVPVGRGVSGIATADLNGDKILDIVTSNFDTDDISILLGKGDGSFAKEVVFTVGDAPFGVAIGDVNGDGKPDIVTPNVGSDTASVLLNQTLLVSLNSPTVNASAERIASINADLTIGTLVINSVPSTTANIVGYTNVLGSQNNDVITGNVSDNRLEGQGGNDTLTGLDGNDILTGGVGRDRLFGSDDDDQLTGSEGNHRLRGGEGDDRFIFDIGKPFNNTIGVDRILDFRKGEDKIVLDQTTFDRLGRRLFGDRVSFASVESERSASRSSALITYVQSTGSLYYNQNRGSDGLGSGGLFATLKRSDSVNGDLSTQDFVVQA